MTNDMHIFMWFWSLFLVLEFLPFLPCPKVFLPAGKNLVKSSVITTHGKNIATLVVLQEWPLSLVTERRRRPLLGRVVTVERRGRWRGRRGDPRQRRRRAGRPERLLQRCHFFSLFPSCIPLYYKALRIILGRLRYHTDTMLSGECGKQSDIVASRYEDFIVLNIHCTCSGYRRISSSENRRLVQWSISCRQKAWLGPFLHCVAVVGPRVSVIDLTSDKMRQGVMGVIGKPVSTAILEKFHLIFSDWIINGGVMKIDFWHTWPSLCIVEIRFQFYSCSSNLISNYFVCIHSSTNGLKNITCGTRICGEYSV